MSGVGEGNDLMFLIREPRILRDHLGIGYFQLGSFSDHSNRKVHWYFHTVYKYQVTPPSLTMSFTEQYA